MHRLHLRADGSRLPLPERQGVQTRLADLPLHLSHRLHHHVPGGGSEGAADGGADEGLDYKVWSCVGGRVEG